MSQQTVLLVVPGLELLRKARALELRVVAVDMVCEFERYLADLVEAAILVDYREWSVLRPLVVAAHEVFGFRAVLSNNEAGLETAGRIVESLGLGGSAFSVHHRLRDKWAMRQQLSVANAGGITAAPVDDLSKLADFGRSHGYPMIVKPVDASSSLGVVRIDGPDDLGAAWERLMRLRGSTEHDLLPIGRLMVEQYIDGPEYSVEAFSFSGRHVVVAVTETETLPGFVEVGHALPARLDPVIDAAVVEVVTGFLDLMGVEDGPSHTEVRISDGTPCIIESHTRTGGDRIGDLVFRAYGIDLEKYTLAWAAGTWSPLMQRPEPHGAAAVRFIVGEPGTVTEIRGVSEAAAVKGVFEVSVDVKVGDVVRPLRTGRDRVGRVLSVGADTDEALARCQRAASLISVVTAPEP